MEKTRGDLTNALRQHDLEAALGRIPGVQQPESAPAPVTMDMDNDEVPNF
jgi:hypothetical protein